MVKSKRGSRGSHDVGPRRKFPAWLQYANEPQRFEVASRENLAWAEHLVKQISPDLHFEDLIPNLAWPQLQLHQASFQAMVARLATGHLTSADVDLLNKRGQLYIQCKLLPARRDQRSPAGRTIRNQDYAPRWVAREPINGLYWQLREWLQQETFQYLTRCAACGLFFLQRPMAATTCSRACRRRALGMPRRQKGPHTRRPREAGLQEDLQRVREMKALWRQANHTSPELSELLAALGMSRKRWTMLQQAEQRERGKLWITDLTR